MARYRIRGSRYRGARYRRYRNPYRFSKYNPYRARSKYLSPYARRGQDYESELSEERTHYSLPPEPRYAQKPEKQARAEVGEQNRLLSREEFFERYPPSFPEHWNEDFRKEVMDRMYDRYVDFMIGKALRQINQSAVTT
ncbi:MAG: hypothetical protein QXO75_09610 [Nitrososphaerota archaeon]